MQIRAANPTDIAAIQAIYAHHVQNGLGTFETTAPDVSEMQARLAQITDAGFPYLVGEDNGRVLGYAYANQFRPRPAYRSTVEDSIYIAPDAIGHGIGKVLLNELVERCAALGLRQMLALIGDSQNAASIGVHRACGFAYVGVLTSVGRKFDRWVDVVIMQRALGAGETTPPA
ncbi:MAG TPA: GNAT family N-acetyltransferase [Burkholderiaceae bacterium]|nr:GNAT family N-acetyltransferase [Burkholderiaceae bacterium]